MIYVTCQRTSNHSKNSPSLSLSLADTFPPEGITASSPDVWSNQVSSRRYQAAPLLPASRKNVLIDVHRSTKRSIDRSWTPDRPCVPAIRRAPTHTHVQTHRTDWHAFIQLTTNAHTQQLLHTKPVHRRNRGRSLRNETPVRHSRGARW